MTDLSFVQSLTFRFSYQKCQRARTSLKTSSQWVRQLLLLVAIQTACIQVASAQVAPNPPTQAGAALSNEGGPVQTLTLAGRVTGANHQAVPSAVVTLRNAAGVVTGQGTTDKTGGFAISRVPLGRASLDVKAAGAELLEQEVEVAPGMSLNLDLTQAASPAAVSYGIAGVAERVEVFAKPDPIQTDVTTNVKGLPTLSTVVTHEEIEHTNVWHDVGDVLNRVPGIAIATVPWGDIGTGIKLRGFFTRPHGAEVATYIDGAPQNVPAATIDGSGINDMSWLLPALIDHIEVVKGPFSALYGDQNRAGSINIVTRDVTENRVSLSYGRFNTVNTDVIFSRKTGPLNTLIAAQFARSDGYRQNSDVLHGSIFVKETFRAGTGIWGVRGYYQGSNWNNPFLLFLASLQAGTAKPTDVGTSPYPFGDANRSNVTLTRRPAEGENGTLFTAYVERYNRRRANPGDPTSLFVSSDARYISGARVLKNLSWLDRYALTIGGEIRSDNGTDIVRQQVSGAFSNVYALDQKMNLLQYAFLTQGQVKLLPSLKLSGGLRVDAFHYDIKNQVNPAASAVYNKPVVTPKIGLAWSPFERVSAFFNMGQGYRSVDQNEISPTGQAGPLNQAGGAPVTSISPPKITSYDYGLKTQLGRFGASAAGFYTANNSEIVQTGAYTYAPSGSSTRIGWEADAHYQLTNALNVYGSITGVEKAYLNNPADGISHNLYVPRFIPKAGVAYLHSVPKGTVAVNLDGFYYSGLPFYIGSPLTLTHTKPYSRYDLRGSYYVGRTELTGFARLQPYRFSSEDSYSFFAGTLVDPTPKWDGGLTVRYRF